MDDWVGVGPLFELFPRLFGVVLNKDFAVSDCYEVREGGTVWNVSFRRGLCLLEEVQYGELLSLLFNVFLCRD